MQKRQSKKNGRRMAPAAPRARASRRAPMRVDDPAVMAEVAEAVEAYERALVGNDLGALGQWFWHDPRTLRYGAGENLVGYAEIEAFRAARPAAGLAREVLSRHITTFGSAFATASQTFRRDGEARVGRQTQTWVRQAQGWRVVAAHVSWMDR